ncbi:MAG: glycosyltransferase family 2 protein [Verrucomicrobia bacterium]|nr:glycosyltransferase family 2 protein [Verrucomicrobiota bacterium]
MSHSRITIAIPTFRRSRLLAELLRDLAKQSVQPDYFVVMDGDPRSGEVLHLLRESNVSVCYVPSNHANLAYQRYLGWRVAADAGAQILVYLDDDLRIHDPRSLELLIAPMLSSSSTVVGCTGEIRFGDLGNIGEGQQSVRDRHDFSQKPGSRVVKLFGSSRGLQPGALTASGHRCPVERTADTQAVVQWLRGGVMAYRMSALGEDCFTKALFALSEIGCGHGEDTLLSRRVASRGRLLMVFNAVFQHPNADAPKAYATKAYRMAWGSAYSRRLLNDNYRWPDSPRTPDRLALWKSYVGNTLLNVFRAVRSPKAHRFAYAWGYLCGALKGVFLPPTHQRLTPHIDWQKDAEAALSQRKDLALTS